MKLSLEGLQMSTKARAIDTLYKAGRITLAGVHAAVESGVITELEYYYITGEEYITNIE